MKTPSVCFITDHTCYKLHLCALSRITLATNSTCVHYHGSHLLQTPPVCAITDHTCYKPNLCVLSRMTLATNPTCVFYHGWHLLQTIWFLPRTRFKSEGLTNARDKLIVALHQTILRLHCAFSLRVRSPTLDGYRCDGRWLGTNVDCDVRILRGNRSGKYLCTWQMLCLCLKAPDVRGVGGKTRAPVDKCAADWRFVGTGSELVRCLWTAVWRANFKYLSA
jgi:hypothetical protein